MTVSLHFITEEEYRAIEEKRRSGYPDNCAFKDFFTPGMAWFNPWYFDPESEEDRRDYADRKSRGFSGKTFLSRHYWLDWSDFRAPITVVCPNGEQWCVDQQSSNGNGWAKTGRWDAVNKKMDNLSAMPSILMPGYHGWLKDGKFTSDLEGRGNGNGVYVVRPKEDA